MGIAFAYTLVMNTIVVIYTSMDTDTLWATYTDLSREIESISIEASTFFGPTFPLFLNETVSNSTRDALGLWYSRPQIGNAINYFMMAIQVIGLYFVIGSAVGHIDEVSASRGIRSAIILNVIVFVTLFPFITYLSLYMVGARSGACPSLFLSLSPSPSLSLSFPSPLCIPPSLPPSFLPPPSLPPSFPLPPSLLPSLFFASHTHLVALRSADASLCHRLIPPPSIPKVDMRFNVFLLLTVVPNTLQFGFACLYAAGSSILPITQSFSEVEGSSRDSGVHPMLLFARVTAPLVPIALLFCTSLFAAMIWADDESKNRSAASVSAATGFTTCLVGFLVCAFAAALYFGSYLAEQIGFGMQTFLEKNGGGGSALRGLTDDALISSKQRVKDMSKGVGQIRKQIRKAQLQEEKDKEAEAAGRAWPAEGKGDDQAV